MAVIFISKDINDFSINSIILSLKKVTKKNYELLIFFKVSFPFCQAFICYRMKFFKILLSLISNIFFLVL